jgi:carboxylate-amine ligase
VEDALIPISDGPFDLGVEEEYQIVDPGTWELRSTIHPLLQRDLEDGVKDVQAEFLQSQVETVTRICPTVQELCAEIRHRRREARKLARSLGLEVVAAGTHPFSSWAEQEVTQGDRYATLAQELQEVGRRLVTFGLHVHVGIADLDLRIRVMNRIRPFLPLLLALSTSSPFFEGRSTGLRSYRMALLAALPRTGIPPRFDTWADYQSQVEVVTREGLLPNPSFIWWDVRPNDRFPTLEIRILDVPTRVEETVCLAAWIQALALKLAREPEPSPLPSFIIQASKWQAIRYGCQARLIVRPDAPARPVSEWVEILTDELADVASEMGSGAEIAYAHTILARGTSADRQLRWWEETGDMRAVVAELARETFGGVAQPRSDDAG